MSARARARPTGVTILAILAGVAGATSILGGLAALGVGPFGAPAVADPASGVILAATGLMVLVLGLAYLALAIGLWELRQWAWELGVALAAIVIALAIVDLIVGRTDPVSAVFSAFLNAAISFSCFSSSAAISVS